MSGMDGEEFLRLRAALGWTQREAAGHLGTTQTTVSHWETGKHPVCPRASVALRALFTLEQVAEQWERVGEFESELADRTHERDYWRDQAGVWKGKAARLAERLVEAERERDEWRRLYREVFASGAAGGRRRAQSSAPGVSREVREALRVLGLKLGATWADVRRAYHQRAHQTHPDKGGTEEAFRVVRDAYEVLARHFGERRAA